jgi:YggT family protein
VIGFAELLNFVLHVYLLLIFVRIILSFVATGAYHPALPLIGQITEPVLAPFRRLLPNAGPFDLSPLFAILAIYLTRALVIAPLNDLGLLLAQ